jgi:hypothetical protein
MKLGRKNCTIDIVMDNEHPDLSLLPFLYDVVITFQP